MEVTTPDGNERKGLPQILLVDDDGLVAAMVAEFVSSVAEVTSVETAERGLELIRASSWDLVVTDVELPGVQGIEFLAQVREADRLVATLVISSYAYFEYAVGAIRAGADDYLTKPFGRADLLPKVTAMLELTASRRAKSREVVLAVGAHPDDVEIGCGGILLRHVAEGDEVTILTLTGGEAGGLEATRLRESQRAADLLGARLMHVDLPDTSISEGSKTITAIGAAIQETAPTIVYTHTAQDVHQDHRNVHRATLVAARGVSRVFCYQSPSSTVEFRPTRFISIDGFLDRKLEVIDAYGSQVEIRRYLDASLLRATARYWARYTTSQYVEPLEIMRDAQGFATLSLAPGLAQAND
ncbi:MAG TPA: PIG-L family deacetylase [Gaiellaceae bacterium]|nr:PIG-L family deacetylase [Gaiellaceae bacterium]